jgi:hypothetical protein
MPHRQRIASVECVPYHRENESGQILVVGRGQWLSVVEKAVIYGDNRCIEWDGS